MRPWVRQILLALMLGVLLRIARWHLEGTDSLVARGNNAASQPTTSSDASQRAAEPETLPDSEPRETPPAVPENTFPAPSSPPVSTPQSPPELAPDIVLENLRLVFRSYSARFGGNPVGTNPEITARLNGRNRKQVVFLKSEDGMRLNDRGELVDHWDTPYFFHQLSNTEMEIRSAGPDRKMWTPDDLVIK